MRSTTLLISFFLTVQLVAQNVPRFSQMNFGKALINPGAIASDAQFSAELLYRYQWMGLPGAPSTFGFVTAYEINQGMGVSLGFLHDQIGITQTNQISAGYAYRFEIDPVRYLSLGLQLRGDNLNASYSAVALGQSDDPAYAININRWNINSAFGVYYNGQDFYGGLSIPSLMQINFRGPDDGFAPNVWHYYGLAGYYIHPSDRYTLNPIVQVKAVPNAPIQGDIVFRNIFNGTFAFSLGYRSENAIIAGFDVLIAERFKFGYSFNHGLGSLYKSRGQAHEVYLALGLPFYYDTNPFSRRKYLNKKGNYNKRYNRKYIKDKRYN